MTSTQFDKIVGRTPTWIGVETGGTLRSDYVEFGFADGGSGKLKALRGVSLSQIEGDLADLIDFEIVQVSQTLTQIYDDTVLEVHLESPGGVVSLVFTCDWIKNDMVAYVDVA